MENRDFKGIWIPKDVYFDERLNPLEKIILMEIDSLDNENHCYASNEYLSKFCQCSERQITATISKLIELRFIEVVNFDGRTRVLKSNLKNYKFPASQKVRGSSIEKTAIKNSKKCEAEKKNLRTIHYNNKSNSVDNQSINHERNEPIDNNSKEYVENLVKERIELARLKEKYPNKKGEIQELYEIIVEMLCSKKETYRLGKEDVMFTDVKYAFLCLNFAKIEYVLDCLSKNTTKVKNTKAYLQTALFNASKTMNNYYSLDAQNIIHNKFDL